MQGSSSPKTLRLVIADDHNVMRSALASFLKLESDFEVVTECSNGEDAWQAIQQTLPDVALLDWRMPGLTGLEVAQRIRSHQLNVKALILTGIDLRRDVIDVLDSVDGLVRKETEIEVLVDAIRTVASGKRYLDRELMVLLRSRGRRRHTELSARELDVLQQLATPATYREIGALLHISETTVRTHVKRIMIKLEQPNRTQIVVEAFRRGIIT